MTREQIITTAAETFEQFATVCAAVNEQLFFDKPAAKWSVAENIKHLVISTNTSRLAYTLPKFLVRWLGGTPNRPSKTYHELVQRYKQKLAEGGRATGRFVPKPLQVKATKEQLLTEWSTAAHKFIAGLQKNSEESLDRYLVRHPLLGRITLRELCYFTIYHTQHHQHIIEQRTHTTSA